MSGLIKEFVQSDFNGEEPLTPASDFRTSPLPCARARVLSAFIQSGRSNSADILLHLRSRPTEEDYSGVGGLEDGKRFKSIRYRLD